MQNIKMTELCPKCLSPVSTRKTYDRELLDELLSKGGLEFSKLCDPCIETLKLINEPQDNGGE